MKYFNKKKELRKTWTKVTGVRCTSDSKRWCQLNGSTDRFFGRPYVGEWWFENSEDALAFKLVWMQIN